MTRKFEQPGLSNVSLGNMGMYYFLCLHEYNATDSCWSHHEDKCIYMSLLTNDFKPFKVFKQDKTTT